MLTGLGTNINVQIMEVGETYRLMTIGGNGGKTIMILSDKVIFAAILVLLVATIMYLISVLR